MNNGELTMAMARGTAVAMAFLLGRRRLPLRVVKSINSAAKRVASESPLGFTRSSLTHSLERPQLTPQATMHVRHWLYR
jgi:hypothetical protein